MFDRPEHPLIKKNRPFLLVGLLLPILIPSIVYAQQQPAGVVTGIQGQAQLTRAAAKAAALRFNDGVVIRDVVDTREKSLARILFGGRSTVTVRELSRLEVREELLPGGARRDVHDLSSGAILVNVARQLMKPSDEVQIRTPNAIAAVRGSTVFGAFNPVLNQSFFAILSGTGTVTPQGLPPVNLTANTSNNGANVSGGGAGGSVQINLINVPPAQANQILSESQVGKVLKEEAGKEQTVQAAAKEAAALASAVVEAATKTEQQASTDTQKTEEAKTEQPVGEEPPATTAPITADTSSALDQPEVEIAGATKTLSGSETLKTFSGTSSRSGSSPVVKITDSTVNRASTGNLVQVDSGADASIAGPLLQIVDSTITDSQLLSVSGTLKGSGTSPFIDVSGGSLTLGAGNSAVLVNSPATLDVKGALFKAKDTTITPGSGVPFMKIAGASTLSAAGSFLDLTNVDLDLGSQVLARIEGGSTFKSTAGPAVKISGGSLKADALVTTDGAGNTLDFTGTILDLTDTTVTVRTLGEDPTSSTDTTKFTPAANEALFKLTNSTLKLTGTTDDVMFELDSDNVGATFNGVGVIATDSTLTLADGFFDMEGTFSSTSTQALLQLTDSTLENTSTLIAVEPGSVTDVTLAGQLLKASGSTVKVFNEDKNTVKANIALSAQPIDSIAVIQDRSTSGRLNRAYVPIPGSDLVQVINTDNNTLVTTITVGDNPVTVRATTNDDRLLVLNRNSNNVSIINTHTNEVLDTITVGTAPEEVGFAAHNNRAFVINQDSDDVTIIDLDNNTIVTTTTVGDMPVSGAVSKKGGNAYVTNSGSDNVTVINTDTGAVVTTISVGTKPVGAVLNPDETRLYVLNETSNDVSVINTSTNAVIATIPVGTTPRTVVITPDGKKAYVVNESPGTVSIIDTATNTVSKTLTIGTTPHDIAIARDGKRAYVANEGSGTVSVIDTVKDTVIATINVGTSPSALAVTQDGVQLFVVNEGSNTVTSIDTIDRADFLEITGGAKLTGNSASPFLEFNPSTVTVDGTLVRVSGSGSSLTLAGPLLKGTDTKFTAERGAIRVRSGGTLKGTGTDAFMQLTGTAADKSAFNTTYSFANVEGTGSKLDLAGPFLSATKTDFSIGAENDTAQFLFFQEGADIKSTSSSPFVTFDNSTLKRAARFLDLARSPDNSAVAAKMEIAGPLLKTSNTSSFTTDRDFIRVTEKATLKGTGTGALIQFTGTTSMTTTGNLGNADFFLIDDTTGESAQGAGSVELAGGLFSDSGGTFTIADRFLNVRDGATLTSTSSDPLIQFSGSTVSTERDLVQIDGTGSKITLSGSLLSAGSTLNIGTEPDLNANALNIHSGGQLLTKSDDPVILFTGGTHTVGNTGEASTDNRRYRLVRLLGVNTDSTTGLGTDQVIKGNGIDPAPFAGADNPIGVLVKATDDATIEVKKGTVTCDCNAPEGKGVVIDTMLYQATAPILDLIGSTATGTTLTTANTTMDIFNSKVVSNGPVVAMDKSFINVTDGPFIHVRGGSLVDVTGDLLKLFNGAKIEVINGPLILVEGTSPTSGATSPAVSELKVSGALVNFGGTGNNRIIVNNSITSTSTISGVKVAEGSTGSITLGANLIKENGVSKPLSSATLGTITQDKVLIQTGTQGKVTITAP